MWEQRFKLMASGLRLNALVQIDYDTQEMTTVATDNIGSFTASFNVPSALPGRIILSLPTDLNTETAVFTMESTPPPVPDAYVPKPDSTSKLRFVRLGHRL